MATATGIPVIETISKYNGAVVPDGYIKENACINFYHIHYKDGKIDDPKYGEYFFEQDILGLLDYADIKEADIIMIDSIYVEPELRSKGLAKEMLKYLANAFKDSLIFTQCVALQKEYPDCPTDDQIQEIVADSMSYFIMNGFTSINDYSCFETREAMIYVNDAAEPIIKYVCKLHRGCKSVWPEEALEAKADELRSKADEDDFQPDKNPEVSKDNEA